MGKDFYTNKEILLGLRDDFRRRNEILLKMKSYLVPLQKNMNIDLYYDNMSEEVELEANYTNGMLISLLRRLYNRKYIYESYLKKSENGSMYLDQGITTGDRRYFPLSDNISNYLNVHKLFNELLAADYPISDNHKILTLNNSIAIIDSLKVSDNKSELSLLEYTPRGDILSKCSKNSDMYEILMKEQPRDMFTFEAQQVIDNCLDAKKDIRIVNDYKSDEEDYGIYVREDEVILRRKLIK